MKKNKSPKMGICTYCGLTKPITSDHVPPKNLFPLPLPPDMMTVPSCRECNEGFKNDDDYFRVALTITEKAKGQRARDAVLPAVVRGFNRPEANRFRAALLSQSAILPRHSAGGVFLGNQRAMAFDRHRLEGTARRIVQGLFFREKDQRLPDDHTVSILPTGRIAELAGMHPESGAAVRDFIDLVTGEPLKTRGDVFGYRWIQSPNGPSNTLWLLYFYGKLEFFCRTSPTGHAARPASGTGAGNQGSDGGTEAAASPT